MTVTELKKRPLSELVGFPSCLEDRRVSSSTRHLRRDLRSNEELKLFSLSKTVGSNSMTDLKSRTLPTLDQYRENLIERCKSANDASIVTKCQSTAVCESATIFYCEHEQLFIVPHGCESAELSSITGLLEFSNFVYLGPGIGIALVYRVVNYISLSILIQQTGRHKKCATRL